MWGLVVVLLVAQQPDYPGPKPTEFWLTQAVVLGLLLGVFYLNVAWAAPRLLHRGRWWAYVGLNAALVLAVLAIHQQVETRLDVPALVATAREAVLNPPNPWSGPRPHPQLGPEEGRPLFNTGVLLITLLVLGIATSLAAMQKGQRDAESRLELERRQVTTELSLLKAQINPHFFFNTLNNIYALTLLDGDQARAALHRLSRMMRYVLYESPAGHTRPVAGPLMTPRGGTSPLSSMLHTPMKPVLFGSHGDGRGSAGLYASKLFLMVAKISPRSSSTKTWRILMMPVCGPEIFVRGFGSPVSSRLNTRMASSDWRPPPSTRLATTMQPNPAAKP